VVSTVAEEVIGEQEATATGIRPKEKEMTPAMKNESEECVWRVPTARAALATFVLLVTGFVQPCLARSPNQIAFPSPEDASRALFVAVQKHDERAVTEILGTRADLVSSDDKMQDARDRQQFVQKYQEMHRLVRDSAGVTALYIGAENWPFPIPLMSHDRVWQFDSDGGANEIRFRRIGENEMTAIGICHTLAAPKVQPGTNGLAKTVLPQVQNAHRSDPVDGYYFRVLSKSAGGLIAIAYPALYRSSGVMTFVVNQDDIVYEKDLGPNTAKVARAMTTYHADPTWTPSESTP
jgi:hypothetical protein